MSDYIYKCNKCKREIRSLSFKCKYCREHYCDKHRLPEDHNCSGLKDRNEMTQERWINAIKEPSNRNNSYKLDKNANLKTKHKHFWRFLKKYFPAIIMLLIIIGIFLFTRGIYPNLIKTCEDGTRYNYCSNIQPLYCNKGELINSSDKCGCPYGYKENLEICEQIPTCSDGTFYSECGNKQFYCENGTLISRASICGCPTGFIEQEDNCIDKYQTNPKNVTLYYILRGHDLWTKNGFKWDVYGGLNDYVSNIDKSIYYTPGGGSEPTTMDFIVKNIDDEKQKEFLIPLVDKIHNLANNDDDRVRIAVSIVQNIPYDESKDLIDRYAYQVLYDNKGVCGEKSRLLVILLRELGYGVALIDYGDTGTINQYGLYNPYSFNHEAVGIKCPTNYSYNGTGYCFIETTIPSIITDSNGDYPSSFCLNSDCTQKLPDEYTLITIADGKSFDSVAEEYNDAKLWNSINNMPGRYLIDSRYDEWESLVKKYGIIVGK